MSVGTGANAEKLPLSRSVYVAETPNESMFGAATGDFLIGIVFAIAGVGSWFVGLGIAYLLYRRWRGDGPRADGAVEADGTDDDEPRAEH